jgi:uncharacterized repeat protein (TIGR01451 family)
VGGASNKVHHNGTDGLYTKGNIVIACGEVTHNGGWGIQVGGSLRVKVISVDHNGRGGINYLTPRSHLLGSMALTAAGAPDAPESVVNGSTKSGNDNDKKTEENKEEQTTSRSNIADNAGYGINTADPLLIIGARDNWWGDATGPGGAGPGSGDEVSQGVDFAQWCTQPVCVVVAADEDPVYAARGMTTSNRLYLQNWTVPSDTVTVAVSDTLGWLAGPSTFTVTLGQLGGSAAISFALPSNAAIGATDDVTVTASSLSDPTATDRTTFQVVASLISDLSIAKEATRSEVEVGESITYTLTISNAGPDVATDVTVTDTLPAEATLASVDCGQGSCTEQDDAAICHLDTIESGATVTATLVLNVVGPSTEGLIINEVEVAANERDPEPHNDQDAAYTTVEVDTVYLPLVLR